MTPDAKLELAEIITNQDKLVELLSYIPSDKLSKYPALQKQLSVQSEARKQLQQAIRSGAFTQEEWDGEVFAMLDLVGYEIAKQVDITKISERVVQIVGTDIDKVRSLRHSDIGAVTLSELLIQMANQLIENSKTKTKHFPWLAERGRVDYNFYLKLDKVYDAWKSGISSHWKLDQWCQASLDKRCPQSVPKFFKEHGDPKGIKEWVEWQQQYEEK